MKKTIRLGFTSLLFLVLAETAYTMESQVDIHGFVSQGYIQTTDNNYFGETEDGSFEFNEFGINFAKELTDSLHVGIQFLSRDFGSNGNNEVNIDWAFGDYRLTDWLGLRAGKIKTPKGLNNEFRDVDMLRTPIFLPQSIYPEILRDVDLALTGIGIYGNIGLSVVGNLSYQVLYGTQNVDPNESVSQALQGVTAFETPIENDSIDVDKKYVISLLWETPLDGLRLGATYDYSDITATAHTTAAVPGVFEEGDIMVSDFDKYQNIVLSAEYTLGDLVLTGEYLRSVKDYDLIQNGSPFPIRPTVDIISDGWYLAASYQFIDWFRLGAYYSESYYDEDDRDGESLTTYGNDIPHRAYFKDICLTTNFLINEYLILKLEGHSFTGTYGVSPLDQEPDENGKIFAEEDWYLFAAKITIGF
jgi:hypothetical protein